MTLARKRTKRKGNRTARKPAPSTPDTGQMLKQIDTMIHELQMMRRQLAQALPSASEAGLTDRLFGAAGHGTWDEYDLYAKVPSPSARRSAFCSNATRRLFEFGE